MISHALLCVFDMLKSHSRLTQVTLNECCSQIIKKCTNTEIFTLKTLNIQKQNKI